MNNESYIVPSWQEFSSTWKLVSVILMIILVVLYFLGYGPGGSKCLECSLDSGSSTLIALEVGEELSVPAYEIREEVTAERVLFEIGSYELPENIDSGLSSVISYLLDNEDSVAVLSGFHDESGDLAFNQELARSRAKAVKDYLVTRGFNAERLILERPFQTTSPEADSVEQK